MDCAVLSASLLTGVDGFSVFTHRLGPKRGVSGRRSLVRTVGSRTTVRVRDTRAVRLVVYPHR